MTKVRIIRKVDKHELAVEEVEKLVIADEIDLMTIEDVYAVIGVDKVEGHVDGNKEEAEEEKG